VSRRRELAIGIVLGLVLGLAIVAGFVFLGSEGSVDAPRVSGVSAGRSAQRAVSGSSIATTRVRRLPQSSR
jgi:Mg/Co/Ni transporter MgtE